MSALVRRPSQLFNYIDPNHFDGNTTSLTFPKGHFSQEDHSFKRNADSTATLLFIKKEELHTPFELKVTYMGRREGLPHWTLSIDERKIETLTPDLVGARYIQVAEKSAKVFEVLIQDPSGKRVQKTLQFQVQINDLIKLAQNSSLPPWAICYTDTEVLAIFDMTKMCIASLDDPKWKPLEILEQSRNDLDPNLQAYQVKVPGNNKVVDLSFEIAGTIELSQADNVYFDRKPFKVVQ